MFLVSRQFGSYRPEPAGRVNNRVPRVIAVLKSANLKTPHDAPRKTRGQDGFATSFPVGLLHPLQHAGCRVRQWRGPGFE